MIMQKVESSSIAAIGFYAGTGSLRVEFTSGETYQYDDVPQFMYKELMESESKGKYFAKHIKNVFRFDKIPKINLHKALEDFYAISKAQGRSRLDIAVELETMANLIRQSPGIMYE